MIIYQQEYDDGVDEIISANASLAYITEAQPCLRKDIELAKANINDNQTIAALNDEDLYYVQSILVSSSWNKNDDIFDKSEVWAAKATPEDKPTNLEHDEDQIVGHIVSNWPIDTDGNTLPESTGPDSLPEKFHIVTGSVIYRNFSNPELKERAENLIQEIKSGKKYVSMECYFNNFDYGLLDKSTGNYKVLQRDNNSAYLTKHLRAYGGVGEYDNFKIGRVLRNINFSGKGFVDKPANPESIIFDQDSAQKILKEQTEQNIPLANNSVSNIQASLNLEKNKMSLEKDVEALSDKVEAMTGCGEVLKEAYSKVTELEAKVMDLEQKMEAKVEEMAMWTEKSTKDMAEATNTIAEKDKLLDENKQKMEHDVAEFNEVKAAELTELTSAHEESIKAKDCDLEALQTELTSAKEAIATFEAEKAELAKQAKIQSRIAELVKTGVTSEVASATVDKFEELDDEAFSTIKALVSSNIPEWAQVKAEESEEVVETSEETEASTESVEVEVEDEETESAVAEDVLENVEVEKDGVDLSVGSEDDSEVHSTRASLVDFVYSRLGKQNSNSNKGE